MALPVTPALHLDIYNARGLSAIDEAYAAGIIGEPTIEAYNIYLSNVATSASAGYAAQAALSAATAEAAAGPTYPNVAAGLAATTDGQAFAANVGGFGVVSIYLNSSGTPVLQRTLATTSVLSLGNGGGFVGHQVNVKAPIRNVYTKLLEHISVDDWGAIGDGTAHTVAEWIPSRYANLTALQFDYPHVTATTDYIDWAAAQAAVNSGRLCVEFGPKSYTFNRELIVPNNVSLIGAGMGHGSNQRTTILGYQTSGALIRFRGFYTSIEKMYLYYQGANKAATVGLKYGTAPATPPASEGSITRTFASEVTVMGFGVGIQNAKIQTSFTHLHYNVYVKDNGIGIDFQYVNHAIFDACFIESNGKNFVFDTFNSVLISGGVVEIFGDNRLSETQASVCFELLGGRSFACRDTYFEVGTQLDNGTSTLKIAEVTNVKGFIFEGAYINRSAQRQAPLILFKDANSSTVSVSKNMVLRGPSSGTDYFVAGDTGFENEPFKFNVYNNAVKSISAGSRLLEKPMEFTPVLTEAGSPVSGIGYAVQEATCILAGDTCTINGKIVLNAIGTPGSGVLQMQIPVMSRAFMGGDNEQIGHFGAANVAVVTGAGMCLLESGSNQLIFYRADMTTTIKANNLAATSTLRFNITFPIDVQAIG